MRNQAIVGGGLDRSRLSRRLVQLNRTSRFVVEALEKRTLLAAVFWTGAAGDGQWTTARNWSSNPALPGSGDDVTINVAGNPTITLGSGTQSIHSLNTADPITVAGATLAVATTAQLSANLTLANADLIGGTYIASAGASLITASTSTLNGVTLNAPFFLPVNGLHILNGLTLNSTFTLSASAGAFVIAEFDGTQTLSGTGQVVFAGAGNYDSLDPNENGSTSPVTLTIGSGIAIHGAAGASAFGELESNDGAQDPVVNQGTIDANVSGQTIYVYNVANKGTIRASAGTISLQGTWSNIGTLTGSAGGTLDLAGTVTTPNLGLAGIVANGAVVNLNGTLTNTGSTLGLTAATGSWNLAGADVIGGNINGSGGAVLTCTANSTLSGVTLGINVNIVDSTLSFTGGLTLNAQLTLVASSAGGAGATFNGTQTLGGIGQVLFGGNANGDFVQSSGGGSTPGAVLTIGAGITMQGAPGATAPGYLQGSFPQDGDGVVNNGIINANASGQILTLAGANFANHGTMEATASGAVLDIEPTEFAGGTALPIESWTNSGTLAVSAGATLELDGNMTTAGLGLLGFHNTGGTVDLIGSLNNAGATLALNAATGSWNLDGGTITGGTISTSTGTALLVANDTIDSTVDGVTLNGSLTVENFANLDVKDGLVLNGVLSVLDAQVNFLGTQTLSGNGQVLFGGVSDDEFQPNSGGGTTGAVLTIGPQITLQCVSSSTALIFLEEADASDSVINQGHINVNAAGVDFYVDIFSNQGNIVVSAGIFTLEGIIPTSALGSISNAGGEVDLTGTLNNAEATFALTAATGSWVLDGGTILGGTITTSGGASLTIADDPTLDGVTLATNLSVDIMTILDGLTFQNNATIFLFESSSSPGELDFQSPTQTLGGNGSIVFDGFDGPTGADYMTLAPAAQGTVAPAVGSSETLTIGPAVQIVTGDASGVIGSGIPGNLIINQGLISAQTAGTSITILDTLQNQGSGQVVQSNGASVTTGSGGTLTFSGSGTVNVNGAINGATVVITSGDVNFNSTTPVTLQSLTISGGTLDGTASIIVTGSATLSGGAMSGTGSTTFASGATATVSGSVVATRALDNAGAITVTAGKIELDGGGTQSGSFTLATGTSLALGGATAQSFAAGSSVTGTGTVRFDQNDTATLDGSYAVGSTLVQDQASVTILAAATTGDMIATGGSIVIGSLPSSAATGTALPALTYSPVPVAVRDTTIISGTASYLVEPGSTYKCGEYFLISGGSPVVELASDNSSPGVLMLGGELDFTGSSGSCVIGSTGSGGKPGEVDLGGACNLVINRANTADDISISAQLMDGSILKSGPGILQLAGPDTYAAGTVISNGVVEADNPAALGSGSVSFAGGMLSIPAGGTITNSIVAGPANSITLNVGSSALQLSNPLFGAALNVAGVAGGSLALSGSITLQNNLVIDNTVPLTINGVVTGGFGLTKTDIGSLTFVGSSSNTYTGSTTINGGTLLLDKTGGAMAIPAGLSIVPFAGAGIATSATVRLLAGQQLAPASALSFDATDGTATFDLNGFNQTVQSLSVTGGNGAANGRAVLGKGPANAAAGATLTASSLSITAGQTLDLTGNNLQIKYTGGSDPIAAIRQYLVSGYGGGSWNGTGIVSSIAAAAGRTLGYADSADNAVSGLAANTILVKYTVPGDANLDGSVNFADLVAFAQHYGAANATWDKGDFAYGGKVIFPDLVMLAQNYNKSLSSSALAASASLTPAIQTPTDTSDEPTPSRHRPPRHWGQRLRIESRRNENTKQIR